MICSPRRRTGGKASSGRAPLPFVSSTTDAVERALRNSGMIESGTVELIDCATASAKVAFTLRDGLDERTLVLAKAAVEQAFRRDRIIPHNGVLDSIWHTTPLHRLAILYLEAASTASTTPKR